MLWRNPWGFKSPYPHQDFYFIGAFYTCPKNHNFANLYTKGMKNLRLLFGVCLGVLALRGAMGLEYEDVVRAASRATAQNVSTGNSSRGINAVQQSLPKPLAASTGRTITTTSRERATTTNDARTTTAPKNVASRVATTATVTPRVAATTDTRRAQSVVSRTATRPTTSRVATKSRTATRPTTSRAATTARTAARTISRAATTANESPTLNTNYTRCRQIYYECMDEFCANKDVNLRRCACSSRATEFDNMKKNISKFEDNMLDFNQRLLLVNMDAEDVNAINQSTAGEDAFYATTDKTKSKRALDDIAKKLNATFGDDDTGTSLAPISLSLNLDSAFDTVDSFMGSDTTAKSGAALYNAAIPICRETALEVCTEDELSLAIGGYLMLMEQDCNTVKKSYQAQADAARSKVFESGALLDMSRLDAYQTRNSDDILTCKRKMMEALTNTTVCGENLEKCLDMTGKYIDPTTGTAFLTENLADLGELITRPDATQSWTTANGAGKFITYLNNKKQFLEPAMENCQDISDRVWAAFIEDALAQIKLAQNAKLEEIRTACTTLTAECLTSAYDSISEFDARALSVFGVAADRTANAMCNDVRTACTALMGASGGTDWESGVSEIATTKTFETLLSSCTQVGRNCIIQSCRSISGNFDLCDDPYFSPNRHAILERTSCWPEVLACVAAAGDDALDAIMESTGRRPGGAHPYSFYDQMYAGNYNAVNSSLQINDICAGSCETGDTECARCRLAERIWGNCQAEPSQTLHDEARDIDYNRIIMPKTKNDTLLSWFAINTGTANPNGSASDDNSCINTRCTSDVYYPSASGPTPVCIPEANTGDVTDDGLYCPDPHHQMTVASGITNCCYEPSNGWGHVPMGDAPITTCCETGRTETIDGHNICLPRNAEFTQSSNYFKSSDGQYYIVCIGNDSLNVDNFTQAYPSGSNFNCDNGRFVLVSVNDFTHRPINNNSIDANTPRMGYYTTPDTDQTAHGDGTWHDATGSAWYIRYGN